MVLDRNIRQGLISQPQVSIATISMFTHFRKSIIQRIALADVNKLRLTPKGQELAMQRPLSLLSKVHSQGISNIMTGNTAVSDGRTHRPTAIQHDHTRTFKVCQIVPHCLQCIIRLITIYIMTAFSILMNNLIRHQHRCIHLDISCASCRNKLCITITVMTLKCLCILQVCTRRYSCIVDRTPLIVHCLMLNDTNSRTELTASLTIGLVVHTKALCNHDCICTSLTVRRIDRRQPLTKQRNALLFVAVYNLDVMIQLVLNDLKSFLTSITEMNQINHVVPTTILRQQLHDLAGNIRMFLLQPAQSIMNDCSLTHTATNISTVEHPLHSQHRVFIIGRCKLFDELIRIFTIRGCREVQVHQCITRSCKTNGTVLSDTNIFTHVAYLQFNALFSSN